MANYYRQCAQFIEHNLRDKHVVQFESANYPPGPLAETIASLASYIWIVGIFFLMVGSSVLASFGIPEPAFLKEIANNKLAAAGVLFLINQCGHSMLTTGAFEIFYNDRLVYSKLESGKLPTAEDLVHALRSVGFDV
jgi:thioredoxin reductase-like selenoprotein T